jgi:hypothetical protein
VITYCGLSALLIRFVSHSMILYVRRYRGFVNGEIDLDHRHPYTTFRMICLNPNESLMLKTNPMMLL